MRAAPMNASGRVAASRSAVCAGVRAPLRSQTLHPQRASGASPRAGRSRSTPSAALGAAGAAAAAPAQATGLRGLYPAAAAVHTGTLRVDELHTLYYEVHGNPDGAPALFLHGGPGAGCFANHARFFDPAHYKIVLLDQRGCGRSTPRAALRANATSDLVSDVEALRAHLGVAAWAVVLGGSWGAALALAYAQAHPDAARALVLRGVCHMTPREVAWVYAPPESGGGAAAARPEQYAAFAGALPPRERGNPLLGYYRRLLSGEAATREAAARAWMSWEMAVFAGAQQSGQPPQGQDPQAPPLVERRRPGRAWEARPQLEWPHPPLPPPRGATEAAAAPPPPAAPLCRRRGAALPAEALAGGLEGLLPDCPPDCPPDSPRPWEWGLPGQGANLWDPEVRSLLLQGLGHEGGAPETGSSAQALLTCHFSIHGAFLLDAPLLSPSALAPLRARGVRCVAVQGGADLVTPAAAAFDLADAWPEAEVAVVAGAGHSMYNPHITHELVCATDRLRAAAPAPAPAHA
ncbi:proline iminopeptidase [Raphidocelis subcapitata]|uniref:prolyl aminopeptidase n=1 Tax=Raphidocelis subcapitata TaxID=307507 RepID=A0A2V0NSZ0_9CHLO|nr:proline iminopeptidase [Raphidocelis subcapitata]|eukprot:GBF90746.1 proline iminopeptidase [Raphidocelis subcapitata]